MFALIRRDGKVGWSDVPAADLGPGEVRIAPRLVGLCRTDLEVASGQLAVTEPRILGHEFVGEVIEAGADIEAEDSTVRACWCVVCGTWWLTVLVVCVIVTLQGDTPAIWAARRGHVDALAYLLSVGCQVC